MLPGSHSHTYSYVHVHVCIVISQKYMQTDPKSRAERKAALEVTLLTRRSICRLIFVLLFDSRYFTFLLFVRYSELNKKSPETCGVQQGGLRAHQKLRDSLWDGMEVAG